MYQIYRIENDQIVVHLNKAELAKDGVLDLTVSAIAESKFNMTNKVLGDVAVLLLNGNMDSAVSYLDLAKIKHYNIKVVVYPESCSIAPEGQIKRSKKLVEKLKTAGIKVTYRVDRNKATQKVEELMKREQKEADRLLKLL